LHLVGIYMHSTINNFGWKAFVPCGQTVWHVGRQIDRQRMKKLMVAFRNSSKAT